MKKRLWCQCRSLQGKILLWALPLDLKKKTILNLILNGAQAQLGPHFLLSPSPRAQLSFSPCCFPLLVVASFSHCIVALIFASCYYSPLHLVALLFIMLFSSLCQTTILLFALCCCSPLCPIVFLSMSHYYSLFRTTLLLSSSHHATILLFTPHYCSPFHVALLLSSLQCCCPFHPIVFLFVHHYSLLRPTPLLF